LWHLLLSGLLLLLLLLVLLLLLLLLLQMVALSDHLLLQHITPGEDRKQPLVVDLCLAVPAVTTSVTLTAQFTKAFLAMAEHPPDAHRGFDVPAAVITLAAGIAKAPEGAGSSAGGCSGSSRNDTGNAAAVGSCANGHAQQQQQQQQRHQQQQQQQQGPWKSHGLGSLVRGCEQRRWVAHPHQSADANTAGSQQPAALLPRVEGTGPLLQLLAQQLPYQVRSPASQLTTAACRTGLRAHCSQATALDMMEVIIRTLQTDVQLSAVEKLWAG
jgi:hypothetical protein